MSRKKHIQSRHEFDRYQEIHGYDQPVEAEQSKIAQEKANYLEQLRRSDRQIKRFLSEVKMGNIEKEETDSWFDENDFAARRITRNRKTHKNRLKGIRIFENEPR